ncbi:MAG: hypothetical protein NDJ92_07845 [Thermoanaerobaculia bacterium]|nr:hypothetical protein [Thermoanaerobaculia bacterium]
MTDDRIDGLIRSLPRTEPSRGFTRRVMTTIEERSAGRRIPRGFRWAHAVAIVVIVVTSLGGGMAWQRDLEARRADALRAETARIRAELDALRSQARQTNEIYLGQSGDREYVLDLRQFTAPNAEVTPVSQTY